MSPEVYCYSYQNKGLLGGNHEDIQMNHIYNLNLNLEL